jgi:hypothetical protein
LNRAGSNEWSRPVSFLFNRRGAENAEFREDNETGWQHAEATVAAILRLSDCVIASLCGPLRSLRLCGEINLRWWLWDGADETAALPTSFSGTPPMFRQLALR